MVFDMTLKVLGKFVDAFCQQRDLNVCAAGVFLVKSKSVDLDCFCFCHFFFFTFFEPERVARAGSVGKRSFAGRSGASSGGTQAAKSAREANLQ